MHRPIDYKQTDPRWGSNLYAVDGETSTIKSAGCGPTSLADVLASLVSPYIDPLTLASWARQHGYKAYKSGTSYSFFAPCAAEYGVKVRRLNTVNIYGYPGSASHKKALAELQAGNWLIACMGKGNWTTSGHYIVAYGYKDGMVYINDPASTKAARACNTWALFTSQVKYYWVVEVPERIRQSGIVQIGDYRHEDFVREVQMCLRAGIDGKAGKQTLSKTITVSRTKNSKHNVVHPLQKLLKQCGYYSGELDKSAGKLFDAAVRVYQTQAVKLKQPDGEITAKGRSWRTMLKL